MNRRRRTIAGVVAGMVIIAAAAAGCDVAPSAQDKENAQQQAASADMINSQPVPNPPYSLMRQNLSEIRMAEATGSVQTTSFEFLEGVTHPIRECASIGLPIPANASISNPHQIIYRWGSSSDGQVTDQMEPNGTYPSSSASGTYVMCIQPNGKARAVTWEGHVHAEAGAAHWDTATQMIVPDGDPTYKFSTKCTMQGNTPVCS